MPAYKEEPSQGNQLAIGMLSPDYGLELNVSSAPKRFQRFQRRVAYNFCDSLQEVVKTPLEARVQLGHNFHWSSSWGLPRRCSSSLPSFVHLFFWHFGMGCGERPAALREVVASVVRAVTALSPWPQATTNGTAMELAGSNVGAARRRLRTEGSLGARSYCPGSQPCCLLDDGSGSLWLFGGSQDDPLETQGPTNNLWESQLHSEAMDVGQRRRRGPATNLVSTGHSVSPLRLTFPAAEPELFSSIDAH